MPDSDGWGENRRVILSGIETLNRTAAELAVAQQRAMVAAEGNAARTSSRLDDFQAWRLETDRRLREDFEKRLRDLEATRSQAIALAALMSVIVGVLAATLSRVLVR